jgi:c-di-GMP-related signal transduction protein
MDNQDTITTIELKRLIVELLDHSPNTRIRFRAIGNMWEKNYLQIVHTTTDNAVIVQDKKSAQMKFVPLKQIVEFEIEEKFREFKPQYHYKVGLA